MASSNTGGWVRRVGASGGGRSYRRRRPLNYYGIIGVIAVFGLASVGFARYDYRHPPAGPSTSYAALAFYACGTSLPSLSPSAGSYHALAGGVVVSSTTGTPTLDHFVSAYPGLTLTSSELGLPASGAKHSHATTYTNDEKCPAGTRDAGKVGHLEIAYWPTLSAVTPTLTTNASTVPLSNNVRISVAFLPIGVTPAQPPEVVTKNMENAISGTASTTTTTHPVTPTTAKAKH